MKVRRQNRLDVGDPGALIDHPYDQGLPARRLGLDGEGHAATAAVLEGVARYFGERRGHSREIAGRKAEELADLAAASAREQNILFTLDGNAQDRDRRL